MNVDYLIVGCGLAGISFAEVLFQNNKSFVVINDNSQNSTKIAGGLYNPVVLKRFTEAWQATRQVKLMYDFYRKVEEKLDCKLFNEDVPVIRKFFSIEEQNNWFIASDKEGLSPFLSTNLIKKKYKGIDSHYDYGEVLQTGYVDVALLLEKYKAYLIKKELFSEEVLTIGVIFCSLNKT